MSLKQRSFRSVSRPHRVLAVVLLASALQACGGGGDSGSAGPTAPAKSAGNTPPTISGTATSQATVGQSYSFMPHATDADANTTLTFSITNKPSWTSFNAATGELTGTPAATNVGTFSNITIAVSDGTNAVSLPAFSITVGQKTGSATLAWMAPTQNEDGSALTVAGYRVYYGPSANDLSTVITLQSATSSYIINSLTAGTYYFAVTALDDKGAESRLSNTVSKVIS